MERNDVSFSIPTWRKEEIKSMGMAEEEALYMTSPYNLNDFKNTKQTIEYIFTPDEEPSQVKTYNAKRELNPKVSKEVGLFAIFLSQIILSDNYFNGTDRLPTSQKNLPQGGHSRFIGVFKQKIMQMNLCKLLDIPKQFQSYYKNEIIKKIIFQFFGKCAYNISLVEILLISNDFLRFCIEVCVKSVLFQGTLITKFTENVEFNDEVKMFVDYYAYLFLIRKEEKAGMKQSEGKPKRIFFYEPNQLRTQHYLLKETKEKKIFLYRKETSPSESTPKEEKERMTPETPKVKGIPQIKLKSAKDKAKTQKKHAEDEPRKREEKGGLFSCCFSCFKQN